MFVLDSETVSHYVRSSSWCLGSSRWSIIALQIAFADFPQLCSNEYSPNVPNLPNENERRLSIPHHSDIIILFLSATLLPLFGSVFFFHKGTWSPLHFILR